MMRDEASAVKREPQPDRFRILADAASEGIVVHHEGTILEVNRAFTEVFRCPREEAVGTSILEFTIPECHAAVRSSIRSRETAPYEIVARRADGTTFDAEFVDRHAELAGAHVRVSAIRDITARKRDEERLRTLQRAVDAATNGIVIAGPLEEDSRVLYSNPAFERMSGYSRSEIVGRNCRFMQGPETDPEATRAMRQAIERGEEAWVRILNYRKDGTPFWNEIRLAPVRDGSGKVTHYVGVMHDVTERIRHEEEVRVLNRTLEERVRQRTAELQAAYHDLESFSHSVSHDLRAPLRSIAFHSELLLEDHGEKLDQEAKAHVEAVRAEAQHVSNLMQALLVLSRSTRGEMRRERVDLSRLASEVGEELRRAYPESRVRFEVEPDLVDEADPRLLRVVLENLLANAWKFSARVDEPRVAFGASEDGGARAYYVRDNGLGFSMEEAGRLFTPFQRLQGARGYEGTGIGLATVQRIIHHHGGRVWAQGEPGRGATFWFTL